MKWTKAHSQNAVRAKKRKRLKPLTPEQVREIRQAARAVKCKRSKAKWRMQIADLEHGGSLTLNLYRLPWPARYVDAERREWSAAKLAKMVQTLLTEAA